MTEDLLRPPFRVGSGAEARSPDEKAAVQILDHSKGGRAFPPRPLGDFAREAFKTPQLLFVIRLAVAPCSSQGELVKLGTTPRLPFEAGIEN